MMKKSSLLLLLAIAAAIGFAVPVTRQALRRDVGKHHTELEWLREEFAISTKDFEKVRRLHDEHQERCRELCDDLLSARRELSARIAQEHEITPSVRECLGKVAEAETACRRSILSHACEVMQFMPPAEGQRYLELVRSRITGSTESTAHHSEH
jgi:hypothetical protein